MTSAHGMLRLVFPKGDCEKVNLAYWAGDAPVIEAPIENNGRRNDTAVRVLTKINEERVTALMDGGAGNVAIVEGGAAGLDQAGRHEALRPDQRDRQRYAERWIADVETFELAGEKITRNRLPINDVDTYDHGMLLGLDYFLSHQVYVSRLQGKVYATWNGGPIFARGRADATQYDQDTPRRRRKSLTDDADGLLRRAVRRR